MLYCTKCRAICEDSVHKCPNCKNSRSLRKVNDDDFILLHRADEYMAQRLASQFEDFSIDYLFENYNEGRVSYLYDSEVMPTDKNVYVKYRDLSTAAGIATQTEQDIEQEREMEENSEEFEEMPKRKRIIVQIVSVIAFLLLVMVVVFGADAIANWLKSFFA